ncbi:MAG: cysteine desulfurase [Geminicoccaceae bacterium]|nr:cysteine desulfurase [Geminicoccaceae bacterium]
MRGRPLVYLDSAASAQKPRAVIDALARFYEHDYANIHRGVYELSQRASALHEEARREVARFLGSRDPREIVFVRNATEGVNLVAYAFLEPRLEPGDEILVTEMEHHANIVPWQLVAGRRGARVVPVPITDEGELRVEDVAERIGPRTRMLAVTWVSNVLGTITPVHAIAELARRRGVPLLVDAAQAAPHLPIDVRSLGADFLVFSGHKTYGPSGVGVLWGRAELLEAMPPWQGGGDMIERVSFAGTTFNTIPFRFEAGTPDIAGIHALGVALRWLRGLGLEAVRAHEEALVGYALERLPRVPGLRVLGSPRARAAVVAFTIDGLHPQDVGTLLDLDGIAIRTGHHCAMPLHERLGLPASARASMGVYTTLGEIDALAASLERIVARFR